jgi:hypothetical protein
MPSILLLLRQRRVTAGNGLGIGLGTTIKYLRRTRNGAAGNGLGTTIKYLWQARTAVSRLATTAKYLRDTASIGLDTKIKYRTQCLCVDPELPPCAHKQIIH